MKKDKKTKYMIKLLKLAKKYLDLGVTDSILVSLNHAYDRLYYTNKIGVNDCMVCVHAVDGLKAWITDYLQGSSSIAAWLIAQGVAPRDLTVTALKEYRRAWVDNMIKEVEKG